MSEGKQTALVVAGLIAFLVLIAYLIALFKEASCHAKFENSTLESRWSIIGGCQVNVPEQGWIPAENYRVL